MSYNGWTNWETWNCHLNFFDCQVAADFGFPEGMTGYDCLMYVEEMVDTYSGQYPQFLHDMIRGYISSVNWDEIAEHMNIDVEVANNG